MPFSPSLRTLLVAVIAVYSAAVCSAPFGPNIEFNLVFANKPKGLENEIRRRLTEFAEASEDYEDMPRRRRVSMETETIEKTLQARGYYDGSVEARYRPTQDQGEMQVEYLIEPGTRYTIGELTLNYPQQVPPPARDSLDLREGDPLIADRVLALKNSLENRIRDQHCLFKVQLDYKVTLFRKDHTAKLTYTLKDSPQSEVGELRMQGLESVEPDYLRNELELGSGDCFKRNAVDIARLTLLQTNLLASAEYTLALREGAAGERHQVDVIFDLNERHHRTLKSGLNYSTDGGPGVLLGWEHRNLMGSAENLMAETSFNSLRQYVKGRFIKPHFLRRDQTLTLNANLEQEEPDSFNATRAETSAMLRRHFGSHTTGELGVALTYSEIEEDGVTETFNLVSVPLVVTHDRRNSVLNATDGWLASTSLTPFTDISKEETRFLRWTATGSAFFTAPDWTLRPTAALRISAGSISGADLNDIPADQRFYVGGGGSVRGYRYQSIGELTDDEPDGGKSYGELSMELRMRIRENWGMVLFLDGGYAYPEELPSLGQNFLWGAGVGVRYHTSFAPIRLDLGFPLDRREEVDDSFQLYISIGQAF